MGWKIHWAHAVELVGCVDLATLAFWRLQPWKYTYICTCRIYIQYLLYVNILYTEQYSTGLGAEPKARIESPIK